LNLIRIRSVNILLVVALCSCAAPAKVSGDKDANGNKIEYVYYTPTGSNIPVRVRKDELQNTDKEKTAEENLIEEAQRLPTSPPPQAANGPH